MTVLHARLNTSETYLRLVPEARRTVSAMMDALPRAQATTIHADGVAVTTLSTADVIVETMMREWSRDGDPTDIVVVRVSSTGRDIAPMRLQCPMDEPDPRGVRDMLLAVGGIMTGVLDSLALDADRRAGMEMERAILVGAIAHRVAERLGSADAHRIAVGLPGPFSPLRAGVHVGTRLIELLEVDQGAWALPPSVDVDLAGEITDAREIVLHVDRRGTQTAFPFTDPMSLLRMSSVLPTDGPVLRDDASSAFA